MGLTLSHYTSSLAFSLDRKLLVTCFVGILFYFLHFFSVCTMIIFVASVFTIQNKPGKVCTGSALENKQHMLG